MFDNEDAYLEPSQLRTQCRVYILIIELQLTLAISNSFISNNRLYRSVNLFIA